MQVPASAPRPTRLGDRYAVASGRVFLSGVQALVRVLLDQHRADAAAGLRTATFISGYQGSPLSGFDLEVGRLRDLASEHEIVHQPGLNEELGATAVWGTQIAEQLPGPRYDGVLGVWYGKAPGVDRSADAIRHGNFVGASPTGGVLALVADDPECKSSTLPSASERLLASLGIPVLYPGSVQEALDLGRHAIACSRASGLWAALKVVTSVADATSTADVGSARVVPVIPTLDWEGRPYVHRPNSHLLAPQSLEMERTLTGVRTALAKRYAQLNGLNPITEDPPGATLGIVTAGTTYYDLAQAIDDLGLREAVPLRVLKLGMLYPLDEQAVREFADGLDEVLVLEEKGPFLEGLVKEALYGTARPPRVVGEREVRGEPLGSVSGSLDPDTVARILHRWLEGRVELPSFFQRIGVLDEIAARVIPAAETRTPFYCSGCPHNLSTVAPEGAIVGAGIGCHTMVMINPRGRGQITGITQMGGEGAQWIGVAPFVEHDHFIQNLGDGTFYHSGSLAVRAAVAAGLNVTYKLLFNDAVAMTGGQHVVGEQGVPSLTRLLEADGVSRIIVTTEDPSRYAGVELASIASVRDRSELTRAQEELFALPGVTVLIHDQGCAAEKRRLRKRGKIPDPPERVLINERICEGCGDCAQKSGCLSVEPVDTEFGPKRRIHQSSCNKDYSCLEGDCPSFMTVVRAAVAGGGAAAGPPPVELPEPVRCVPGDDFRVRLVGIGGTGVVTVSQVLGVAAMLEGRSAAGVDQTGLAQKGGPVVSELHISESAEAGSSRPHGGGLDLLLGLDPLGSATARNLAFAHPRRTVAVVCSGIAPTGRMVVDPAAISPELAALQATIDGATRAAHNVYLDARALAMALFGDHMPANVIVLGAAWQRGAVPLALTSIEEAVRLNGAAVEKNLAAFAWGRACVAAPEVVAEMISASGPAGGAGSPVSDPDRALIERVGDLGDELRRVLEIRVPDLVAYQSRRYAERYADAVARVAAREREALGDSTAVTDAVARNLYKLMAYKDEYEVARLYLDFLSELDPGAKVAIHLHPPILRAMGMKRKLKLGRWFVPVLALLRRGRRLRGTPVDVFGWAAVRRVERALPGEYLALVDAALARLDAGTVDVALEICELPDVVRGYESIKLASVERFRARGAELSERLAAEPVAA